MLFRIHEVRIISNKIWDDTNKDKLLLKHTQGIGSTRNAHFSEHLATQVYIKEVKVHDA